MLDDEEPDLYVRIIPPERPRDVRNVVLTPGAGLVFEGALPFVELLFELELLRLEVEFLLFRELLLSHQCEPEELLEDELLLDRLKKSLLVLLGVEYWLYVL